MEKPKCLKCGKKISRTIGFIWPAPAVYYLNSMKTSVNKFWGTVYKKKTYQKQKEKVSIYDRNEVLGFFCNKCGARFPDTETKSIKAYLYSDHVILKLQDDYYHNSKY